MSDQSGWPAWTPPGDATSEDDAASRSAERDTAGQPSGPTGSDDGASPPPPPPPPPEARYWPPPTPGQSAGPSPTYATGGWQAPPPPRRRTGLVVGILAGVVVLALVIGAGLLVAFRSSEPVSTDGGSGGPAAPAPDDVPVDDVEAQTRAILETIDTSEQRMIAFQEEVVAAVGDDGNVGDAAQEVARAAQRAGDDLTEVRSRLMDLGGGEGEAFDGLRDIRDTYGDHMDAWIEYVDAVGGTPTLAGPESTEAQPYWRDINVTGDAFVDAVAGGLPDDVPAELQDLADEIVDRGFGGYGGGQGNLV